MSSAVAARSPFEPGTPRPRFIAHAAGNSEAAALAAIPDGPDFLEVDIWTHNDHLEARHERAAYPFPLWFEKWYFKLAPRQPFSLAQLLATLRSRAAVMLDMKNGTERAAQMLRASIERAPGATIAASSQSWNSLRWIAHYCPGVDLFYSIDVLPKLDLFLSVLERDYRPRGVSCRHTLLDSEVVAGLHDRGMLVIAWTVDDIERARDLVAMGVDGLTTHRVADFREAFGTP
ncbi:glycerophosphodiester phosphodiesterase [bacterium]|jgi:glycerophosphoryl diester phosphodiesterase|nr:glycerophosphodiester phosphodiesterase [bacterium]